MELNEEVPISSTALSVYVAPSVTTRRSAFPATDSDDRRGKLPGTTVGAVPLVHVISVYAPGATAHETSAVTAPPHASVPTASGAFVAANERRAPAASARRATVPVPPTAAPFVTTQSQGSEPSTARRPSSTFTPPVIAFAPASVHVPLPSL